jgi:hypothetical protein
MRLPIQQFVEESTGRNVSIGAVLRRALAARRKGIRSIRTARDLHRARQRIWSTIAEGRHT